jgi:hypothetical protein
VVDMLARCWVGGSLSRLGVMRSRGWWGRPEWVADEKGSVSYPSSKST